MVVLDSIRQEVITEVVTEFSTQINNIATGSGTTPTLVTDTSLELETFRSLTTGTISDNRIRYRHEQDINENNGNNIAEIGTFNDAVAGEMYSRSLLNVINKENFLDFVAFIDIIIR